jgi:hypothetical protein
MLICFKISNSATLNGSRHSARTRSDLHRVHAIMLHVAAYRHATRHARDRRHRNHAARARPMVAASWQRSSTGRWAAADGEPSPSTRPHADVRLRADARGRDGGVRQELAAGVSSKNPEVRFRGQSGKHLLHLRFPVLTRSWDPEQTFPAQNNWSQFASLSARSKTRTAVRRCGFDPWGRL